MKILVVIVTRIGDTLLATPSIRAIKQKYPDSELTVMAHPNRYQVLENLFFIDKLKQNFRIIIWQYSFIILL